MSFAHDSIRTFITRSSLVLVNILGGVIYARWLGPEGVGIMALLMLMQNFTFRFGNLGFGSSFSFFIARGKTTGREVLGLAFSISIIMTLLCCAILLAVWQEGFSPWRDVPSLIFYLSLFSIMPFFINNFLAMILSGHLDIRATNISEIIRTCCNLPLVVFTVIVLKLGVLGAVLSYIFSQLTVFCYLLLSVKNKEVTSAASQDNKANMKLLSEMWQYGRWNYLLMFFNFYIGELPIMVLSYFHPYNIVGFFSMGRGLMEKTRILPNSFSQALFPYTAASEEKVAVNRTNTLCRNFMMITGCMLVVLVIVARPVVVFLYGEAFVPVVAVFYALIPAIMLWPLAQFLTVHVAGFGNPKRVLMRSLIALPVCILACFLFIPYLGAVGAALSVSIVYVVLAGVSVYIYIKSTGAKLLDMIFLRKEDWNNYRGIIKKIGIQFGKQQET